MIWLSIFGVLLAGQNVVARDCYSDEKGVFYGLFCNTQFESWSSHSVCVGTCEFGLPQCVHGSAIEFQPFDKSTQRNEEAAFTTPQLAQRCKISQPSVQGPDGEQPRPYEGHAAQVWFPLKKRRCTPADAAAVLGTDVGSFNEEDFIYTHFMTQCAVEVCGDDYAYPFDSLPCFGLHKDSPVIYLFDRRNFEWCAPYATDVAEVEGCKILPACAGHPIMDYHQRKQSSFVRITVFKEFTKTCEVLCPDGESNWRGEVATGFPCRRLYVAGDSKFKPVLPIAGGFCSDEISQLREHTLDCAKRPVCSGAPPEAYSSENPFGSDVCAPLRPKCRRHELSKYVCDELDLNKLPFCDASRNFLKEPVIYDDCDVTPLCTVAVKENCVEPLADCSLLDAQKLKCAEGERVDRGQLCQQYGDDASNCEPAPLCIDTIRSGAHGHCEELCTSLGQENCRRIPGKQQPDPFDVIGRIKRMRKETRVGEFLAQLSAATGQTLTQDGFEGLELCREEESVRRTHTGPLCSPKPICESGRESDCVSKLTNCNNEESKEYVCGSTISLPLCEKYEIDPARLLAGECIGRVMCDDITRGLISVSDLDRKFVSYYSLDECEKICGGDESGDAASMTTVPAETPSTTASDTNDENAPARYRRFDQADNSSTVPPPSPEATDDLKPTCRARPTVDHDPWNVAKNDATRAQEWCSVEDSMRIAIVHGCNKLPICSSNFTAPESTKLNPFYAVDDECIEAKADCSEEEAREFHCANVVQSALTIMGMSAGAFVIIVVIIVVVIGAAVAGIFVMKKGGGTPMPAANPQASTMSKTTETNSKAI